MTYTSTIIFTLDTICPWTYIAYLRLRRALTFYQSSNPSSPITFTLRLAPYQLYPDFPTTGQSKYDWYLNNRYHGDVALMDKFVAYMTALGKDEGIEFNFREGEIAGTWEAHRVLWVLQDEFGEEKALRALESLYKAYFEEGAHPSSHQTLLKACTVAGISDEDANDIVEKVERGAREVKMALQEQVGNAVDSVPYVVFEGKRRDFTEVGAKTVGEYGRILGMVEKEAT